MLIIFYVSINKNVFKSDKLKRTNKSKTKFELLKQIRHRQRCTTNCENKNGMPSYHLQITSYKGAGNKHVVKVNTHFMQMYS